MTLTLDALVAADIHSMDATTYRLPGLPSQHLQIAEGKNDLRRLRVTGSRPTDPAESRGLRPALRQARSSGVLVRLPDVGAVRTATFRQLVPDDGSAWRHHSTLR